VARRSGPVAWGAASGEFERDLAAQASDIVLAPRIWSESRRGRDSVTMTVIAADGRPACGFRRASTMRRVDIIIAVRVKLDSGADRYFLTWGDLGPNRPWPGDIERAVLKSSPRWALGGTAVDARVCDSLQAASGERYFYENLTSMQYEMPRPASRTFLAWAGAMTAAVLRGEQLHYLGRPDNPDDIPAAGARFGFTLECYEHDGTLVSSYPLDELTAQDAQQLLGDEDIDRVMCLGHPVSGPALTAIIAERPITADETAHQYVLSPWADPGYRTPRGYYPPPP
jgi:hypothetical protein